MPQALPRVIAHRGASAEAPENTLASFRRALELGCRAIELDVHLTRDGVPVVIHDDRLERTTDGAGPVGSFTLAELKRLDAGAWHASEHAGERIPTLAEALELARGRDAFVNIEVKTDPVPYPGIEDAVARDVAAAGMGSRVFVTSFDPDVPRRYVAAKHACAGTGVIVLGELPSELASQYAEFADAVGLYAGLATSEAIAIAREAKLAVVAWTVNEPDVARALLASGVDAVITDDPRALRDLF